MNRNKIDGIFLKLIIINPIINMTILQLINSGKIISMPENFPSNRGVWNAMGIAVVLVLGFIFSFLVYIIGKKYKK